MLRNPFAMRDGRMLLISDLTGDERGLKCCAVCPECKGKFEAKMGEVMAHHFAHTKDACDETSAFIKSLLLFVKQMIEDDGTFFAPALELAYQKPTTEIYREDVKEYVRIVTEEQDYDFGKHTIIVGDEKTFKVDTNGINLVLDSKNRAEALIVTAKSEGKRLAVRVWPPKLCKAENPRPYDNLSTLACDAREIDFYGTPSEQIITQLKEQTIWRWLQNTRIERGYDMVFHEMQKLWGWLRWKRAQEEKQRQQRAREMERQRVQSSQIRREADVFKVSAIIYDRFGTRWVKCIICGGIKQSADYDDYGGKGSMNRGTCKKCRKLRENDSLVSAKTNMMGFGDA